MKEALSGLHSTAHHHLASILNVADFLQYIDTETGVQVVLSHERMLRKQTLSLCYRTILLLNNAY